MSKLLVAAKAEGDIVSFHDGLSFWGGVDPATGVVIDAHHPQHGQSLAGKIVMMPTSRGSCSGSGLLLELAMNGHAPAALIFREAEDVLTLGAMIAAQMFDKPVAVARLTQADYDGLAACQRARVDTTGIVAESLRLPLTPLTTHDLDLSAADHATLTGAQGPAAQLAMQILCLMAAAQGATRLTDVTRGHIDGCIYHSAANLRFAETMVDMGARVIIPTTINAISVDHANWRAQHVPPDFGNLATRLADAYVKMGAYPTFTCAPYLLQDAPVLGEDVGWSESNAVIYANSMLGARTVKHPDYLDLFIALTGRAPQSGVYLAANRVARRVITVECPTDPDDAFWPLLGWLAGEMAPDCIPLLTGLDKTGADPDAIKALCAAFGTTSAAPMLHVAGITPESQQAPAADADAGRITRADFARAWHTFNGGPEQVDLVALGSPHFSLSETRRFAGLMAGQACAPGTATIITMGRATRDAAAAEGLIAPLEAAGVRIVCDLCWCSITEPVFPPEARTLMTNSGKYAHYAPGLSGRAVRFGGLTDCARAALTGRAGNAMPDWLRRPFQT